MGTRSGKKSARAETKDHPHACGDKNVIFVAGTDKEGSSPRVWGQVFRNIMLSIQYRIIPTRVGTSYIVNKKYGGYEDHPHACGDKA